MTDLNQLLRDRVAEESIDLDVLAGTAVRRGRRLRRVRRTGACLAAAAVLAAVGAGVATMAAGTGPGAIQPAAGGSSPAAAPSLPGTLHAGQVLDLGDGVTGVVTANGPAVGQPLPRGAAYLIYPPAAGSHGHGLTIVVDLRRGGEDPFMSGNDEKRLQRAYPGARVAVILGGPGVTVASATPNPHRDR